MRLGTLLLLLTALAVPTASEGAAAGAAPAGECSVVSADGTPLDLLLTGLQWDGLQGLCERLAGYLRLGGATPEGADRAGRLLRETGFFAEVACAPHGAAVRCVASPMPMVHEVRIEGEIPFAVLEDDLQRRVFLKPGALLEERREAFARQRKRLEDYLRRQGYFGSVVRLATEEVKGAEPNQGLRLDAHVQAGRTVQLHKIEIRGHVPEAYGYERVEKALQHYWLLWWFRSRFRPEQFEDDLLTITRDLQRRGWPEARVTGDWSLDLTRGRASVIVRVEAGPRLVMRFEGNEALGDGKLEDLATFLQAGVVDPVEIENTASAIHGRYQEKGYYRAAVSGVVDQPDEHTLVVTFRIDEGPRAEVRRVRFEGTQAFPAEQIPEDVELLTRESGFLSNGRWVDAWVAADVRAIEAWYEEQGYAAAKVTAERIELAADTLEVVFRIQEGPRRQVARMTMEGLPEEVDREALLEELALTEGEPYVHAELGSDRREILSMLVSEGYARADVERDMVRPTPSEGGDVTIHYRIHAGPKSLFGGVIVRGNFRTSRKLIENELSLKAGDPLDLVTLGRARRDLRALGPFFSVELEPLDLWTEDPDTWLLVAVQERDAQTLDAVLAASTDDGASVGLDYRDRNLFGRAVRLDLRLRTGTFGDVLLPRIGVADRGDVTLRAPEPLGLPFDVEGTAFYRYEDKARYTERRTGAGVGLIRQVFQRGECFYCADVTLSLRYELAAGYLNEHTKRFLIFDRSYGVPTANVGRIVPGLSLDRRDSFVDPRRGYSADLRLELAHHLIVPFVDGEDFWRTLVSAQGYLPLGTPWRAPYGEQSYVGGPLVLALAGTWGAGRPYGISQRLPESESFWFGGDYSVRGMQDRASLEGFPGAQYLFVGNLELRWYGLQNVAFGDWQLAAFLDVGAANYTSGTLFDSPVVSVGGALRYVTPVGPLSVAYAVPVVRPEEIILRRDSVLPRTGRLHITFGYPF